jgi:hypothetical protein
MQEIQTRSSVRGNLEVKASEQRNGQENKNRHILQQKKNETCKVAFNPSFVLGSNLCFFSNKS